ncbi:MAG: sulfotransferase [Flavobacteriaceae bacterium]|nr:sulfotransferase [Flavobacteriaceae bacterium]
MPKKPILVTGAHRSGSTWVGKIVNASPLIRYVHEPFNPERPRPQPPFGVWFKYFNEQKRYEEEELFHAYLQSFLKGSLQQIKSTSNKRAILGWVKEWRSRWLRRTVFKDPIALFSAPWMHEWMNCDVVVVIRHPAAFVASLKVKDWQFDFQDFWNQPELIQRYLQDYSKDIETMSSQPGDIIDQGILLWNCFYSVVQQYYKHYGDRWYFVTHEALSLSPEEEFRKLFAFLDVPWSGRVLEEIEKTTQGHRSDSIHKRDSRANVHTWKNRLAPEEITKIKKETRQIWTNFYSEMDW